MTHVNHRVLGLALGIGLASSSQVLTQSSGSSGTIALPGPATTLTGGAIARVSPDTRRQASDAAEPPSTSAGDSSVWSLDTGVSMNVGPFFFDFFDPGAAGWVAVGSGTVRLHVEYWYKQYRFEDRSPERVAGVVVENYRRSFGIKDSIQVAVSRHFRTRRRLSPYFLFGAGYHRTRAHGCYTRGIWYERRLVCSRSAGGHPLMLGGAGIDVSFASRFFVRVQARAFLGRPIRENIPWLTTLVGGGVRF